MIKGTKEKDLMYRNCPTSGYHFEWEIPTDLFLQPSSFFVCMEKRDPRWAVLAIGISNQNETAF